jgi:uncharacterized protein
MKNYIFLFLCGLLLYFSSYGQEKSNQPDNKIVIGKINSFHSKILNEERKIRVYVPTNNENNPKHNYPVLYLLDGENHFNSVMGMIQQLSEVNGNMILPQMILIGIQNTNRERDLGGEAFSLFIEKELIPYVDSMYPTTQYRTLIGHSLGGLMVINSMINHPRLFKSYIAIDPSSRFDSQKLIKQANIVFKDKDFSDNSLYLAIANSTSVNFEDTSINNPYRANLKIATYFEDKKNNLQFKWKFYKDDNHTSVPLIASYDGLRFIFAFYKFPDIQKLLISPRPDSIIDLTYQNISRLLGYKILPPEGDLAGTGFYFLQNKMYDKSYNIFKMLIDNYPPNFMSYNAMGELFICKGDTKEALKYLEKSLTLNPNDGHTKDMIKKMKNNEK